MNSKGQVTGSPVEAVDDHFAQSPPDEVLKRSEQLILYPKKPFDEKVVPENSALAHTRPSRVEMQAYLASALTGLSKTERALVFHISDVISQICLEHDIILYEPRKKTDPVHNAEVSDADVFKTDHDRVVSSDLLIHLCHFSSTGSGEELSFAYHSLVPIILIAPGDQKVSRMITGIPSLKLEVRYQEPEDLRFLLTQRLMEIRPYLEQRRLWKDDATSNIVGFRIRDLRLEQGLTRGQLAERVGLTEASVAHLEENADSVSNPSLTQLRAIATALKTTVAELIVPDLNEYILSEIQASLYEKIPARFQQQVTDRDKRVWMRRYLYRVLDHLDKQDG